MSTKVSASAAQTSVTFQVLDHGGEDVWDVLKGAALAEDVERTGALYKYKVCAIHLYHPPIVCKAVLRQ